jgi:hypothetical protein
MFLDDFLRTHQPYHSHCAGRNGGTFVFVFIMPILKNFHEMFGLNRAGGFKSR